MTIYECSRQPSYIPLVFEVSCSRVVWVLGSTAIPVATLGLFFSFILTATKICLFPLSYVLCDNEQFAHPLQHAAVANILVIVILVEGKYAVMTRWHSVLVYSGCYLGIG